MLDTMRRTADWARPNAARKNQDSFFRVGEACFATHIL